jgi:membrane-associated protein
METFVQLLFDHALHAHWIVFGALVLSGLNLPISEDLLIILSAAIAALIAPENLEKLFLGVFFGCVFSDWIAYSLGRALGPKLWDIRWFAKLVDKKRLGQIQKYYTKYGFWTLLVGRFIPFGVRNCLLLAAGLGKMHRLKFGLSDGIACLCSNTALFFTAYSLSKNYTRLISAMKTFNIFIFSAFVVSIIAYIWYKKRKKVSI